MIVLDERATAENYDEIAYLIANPDVAQAVAEKRLNSGRQHFDLWGHAEPHRMLRHSARIDRTAKMARVKTLLRDDMAFIERGQKLDFLNTKLRTMAAANETDVVSSAPYDSTATAMIESLPDGLILDCGAGRRPAVYYDNVVNYEIVDYDTTDVLGIGEVLPFRDNAFDAVMSFAVLEHVKQPWLCAAELARVLKPGGRLLVAAPFMFPYHGYPGHYFNMSQQGIRALFEPALTVDDISVPPHQHPIYWLVASLVSWSAGLDDEARAEFGDVRVKDLMSSKPWILYDRPWAKGLAGEKVLELAAGTVLQAHKPPA